LGTTQRHINNLNSNMYNMSGLVCPEQGSIYYPEVQLL